MEITINRRKIYWALIGCTIFILICIGFIIDPAQFSKYALRSSGFIRLLGIICLVFLVIGFFRIINRLKHGKVALKIDENGIFEPSLLNNYIEWKDISGIRKKSVMSSNFLIIDVANSDYYMLHSVNKTALSIMSSNMKVYKTPIVLTSNYMKCSFNELEQVIQDEFKKFKKTNI